MTNEINELTDAEKQMVLDQVKETMAWIDENRASVLDAIRDSVAILVAWFNENDATILEIVEENDDILIDEPLPRLPRSVQPVKLTLTVGSKR